MDEFYDANKQPEQSVTITYEDTCCGPIFTGTEGTKLYLHSSLFELPDGTDLTVPYDIKLIELYPIYDMIYYKEK